MKKYLMTGMAAIAFCAAFTSCSKDENLYDPEAARAIEIDQVYQNYNEAFIKTFGKPAANQEWGFGSWSGANTRNNGIDNAINVNGNMWNPEDVPAVDITSTPTEVQAIYDYVKYTLPEMTRLGHVYATEVTDILDGYYVTQVRNGKNSDNQDPAANGSTITNEGSYMNHLQIAFNQNPTMDDLNNSNSHDNKSGWQHINNFNASDNYNHANAAQSPDHGNTKVEHKGAFDFAYHNSLDSKYHNNWILVDGYYITEDHKYENFYYVCFDFESMPDGVKTQFSFSGLNDSNQMQTGYNGDVDGYYSSVAEILAAWQAAGITKFTGKDGKERNISEMDNITITGYQNGDKVVFPDDIHTDWIIRITKGASTPPPSDYDIRIIAEDLNAQAVEGDTENSDWDFNDVVFDVKFTGDNTATIRLVAAGGTLPLTVNGEEVHRKFGQDTDVMINTKAQGIGKWYETNDRPTWDITLDGVKDAWGKNIPVQVQKTLKDGSKKWFTLEAQPGTPAAKIGVKPTYNYCMERVHISTASPMFGGWVQNGGFLIWWTED